VRGEEGTKGTLEGQVKLNVNQEERRSGEEEEMNSFPLDTVSTSKNTFFLLGIAERMPQRTAV
jgi:hypothetical protein